MVVVGSKVEGQYFLIALINASVIGGYNQQIKSALFVILDKDSIEPPQ